MAHESDNGKFAIQKTIMHNLDDEIMSILHCGGINPGTAPITSQGDCRPRPFT